jgi:glutamate racemase
VAQLLGPADPTGCPEATAVFTSGENLSGPLRLALAGYGLVGIATEPMPLRN